MKIVNNIFKAMCLPLVLAFASCNSDIDPVYVETGSQTELSGASNEVILTAENPQALAMTIYWTGDGKITLSDPKLQAAVNAATQTIQLSKDEAFTEPLDIAVDKDVRSYQFLSESLNALLGRLGYTANEKAPLWIRVKSSLADNINPSYSNVIKVMVQSYHISLTLGTVLDKDWNETTTTLGSAEENGIYTGFMGASSWDNWWFREANQVVWGNLGENGKPFYASSDDSHWNFWFPGSTGCYYTTLNTVEGWWSALYIPSLTVAGDITGSMVYNKKSNQWTLPINLATASTVTITISGSGSLYNYETTDTGTPIDKAVAFSGDSQNLTFGSTAGNISVALPAGNTTLILDLSNPLQYKITTGEAEPEPETPTQLYLSGIVDWADPATGSCYLSLYEESSLSYAGAHYIKSEYGYRAYTEQSWSPAYKAADGATALSGSLVLAESDRNNIPAPEEGLYVMDFSMKNLTYELTKVEKVTYAGLNDVWDEQEMTQSADNKEIFTAEFEKTKETSWGVKVLINGNWSLFFGGSSGALTLGKSDATTGFDGDNDLKIGKTYILTVDFGKQTYSYTLK